MEDRIKYHISGCVAIAISAVKFGLGEQFWAWSWLVAGIYFLWFKAARK